MSINSKTDAGEKGTITESIRASKSSDVILSKLSQDFKLGNITMDSPIPCFMKFYDLLEGYTIRVEMQEKYKYKPEIVAKDYYGNSDLWWLVLYMSKITKHEDFNIPSFKILDPHCIEDLFQIIERSEKEIGLTTVLEDRTLQKVR